MLKNLKVWHKLALVAAVFVFPLGLLIFQLINEQNIAIEFARSERRGIEGVRPVSRLLGALLQHREDVALALVGDAAANARVAEIRTTADAAMNDFKAVDREYGAEFKTGPALEAVTARWRSVKETVGTGSSAANLDAHRDLIGHDLLALILDVGNGSKLTLDPDLDAYWVMNTLIEKLPALMEDASDLRARAATALASAGITPEQRAGLTFQIARVRADADKAKQALAFALTATPRVSQDLGAFAAQADQAARALTDLVEQRIVAPPAPDITLADFATSTASLTPTLQRLYDAGVGTLDALLVTRVEGFQRKQLTQLGIALGAVLVAIGILVWIVRLINAPVRELSAAATKLKNRDYNVKVTVHANDELASWP